MSLPTVLFMGGNGHCTARLDRVRAVLDGCDSPPFALSEIAYPGFEGRPRAASFEAFLDAVRDQAAAVHESAWIHATGIGGLLVLALRARGELLQNPIMMQAPVLWGLERRRFPKLMRLAPARRMLRWLFARPAFQRWFVRRHLETSLDQAARVAFFDGYAQCAAFQDFFLWLTPALLRQLEHAFSAHPERLQQILMLWGQRDRVVTLQELELTEKALGHQFERRALADWGHYPMIDAPESWVEAVAREVAS